MTLPDSFPSKRPYTREDFGEAMAILVDVWTQFSIDTPNGANAGGLSTLEWVDEFLTRMGEKH